MWTGFRPRVLLVTTIPMTKGREFLAEYGPEYWEAREKISLRRKVMRRAVRLPFVCSVVGLQRERRVN